MKNFFAVLACLMTIASPLTAKDPLRVVVDPWAPFGGEELINGGISLDVISTVLGRAGYEVEQSIVPWKRAVDGVRGGRYDILGNLFFLEDLAEFLTYSEPFYESEVRFLRRRGSTAAYHGLDSLRPFSIAVGAGYLYEEQFDHADFLNKKVVTTTLQGMRMVASGRVDLTVDSLDVLTYAMAVEAPELLALVEVMPNTLAQQSIHMAIRQDYPKRDEILSDFNRVLSEMKEDGSLDELLAKHKY